MTVRRQIAVAAALLVLLVVSGCGDRGGAPLPAETDEPLYVQGMQLKRQGRHAEALNYFVKLIDKRGEKGAAESHIEAGVICLNTTKDPVEAYHHFRRYLELEPKSKQADGVRGQVQAALREFARSIPGRPLDDQSVRLQADDELARLRRENDELRAELATLRGGGAVPLPRSPRLITLPEEVRTVPPPSPAQAPAPVLIESPVSVAPRREPERLVTPAPQPQKSPAASRGSGRTHTVRAGENLFRIGQQYGLKADQLAAANRDVLPAGANSPLRPGMVLKLP